MHCFCLYVAICCVGLYVTFAVVICDMTYKEFACICICNELVSIVKIIHFPLAYTRLLLEILILY